MKFRRHSKWTSGPHGLLENPLGAFILARWWCWKALDHAHSVEEWNGMYYKSVDEWATKRAIFDVVEFWPCTYGEDEKLDRFRLSFRVTECQEISQRSDKSGYHRPILNINSGESYAKPKIYRHHIIISLAFSMETDRSRSPENGCLIQQYPPFLQYSYPSTHHTSPGLKHVEVQSLASLLRDVRRLWTFLLFDQVWTAIRYRFMSVSCF